MNVTFLHHHEDERIEGLKIAADAICGMYGYQIMRVDCTADKEIWTKSKSINFFDLDEALSDPRFDGCQKVFFDPMASNSLADFQHPPDNVLYIVGHDSWGYSGRDIYSEGEVLYAPSDYDNSYEHWAISVLIAAANHRFYQLL